MLANNGEITPPCGVPATVRSRTPSTITPACSHNRSSLSTRRSETRRLTSVSSRSWFDLAEEIGDIKFHHKCVTRDEPGTQPLHRRCGRPLRPKPIRARHEVRLEDRFQHDLGRRLGHPVPNRGNPQRPLTTSWFRDLHPTRRRRTVHTPAKVRTQL